MANTQSQYGFAHFGYLPGYAVDYQLTQVPIRPAYSTQIGFGDPVAKENTASAFIAQMTPTLITSNICMGIFQGCLYTPSGGGAPVYSPFWPGAQGGTVATAYIINSSGCLVPGRVLQRATWQRHRWRSRELYGRCAEHHRRRLLDCHA